LETPIRDRDGSKHNPRLADRHERFPQGAGAANRGYDKVNPMLSYLLRRILQMIPTLAGVILLVFFLFKYFGGDPAEILGGQQASAEQIESIRNQLGLNKPVWEQLWLFVTKVATFDWGRSWTTNEAVSNIFATRLPATLTIMIPILILEVSLAIVCGMAVAYVRGSLTDRAVMIISTVALSISAESASPDTSGS